VHVLAPTNEAAESCSCSSSASGPAPSALARVALTVARFPIGQAHRLSATTFATAPCSADQAATSCPADAKSRLPSHTRRLQLQTPIASPQEGLRYQILREKIACPAAGPSLLAEMPSPRGLPRCGAAWRARMELGELLSGGGGTVWRCCSGSWGGGQGQPPRDPRADEEAGGGYRRRPCFISTTPKRLRWLSMDQLQRRWRPSGELRFLLPSAVADADWPSSRAMAATCCPSQRRWCGSWALPPHSRPSWWSCRAAALRSAPTPGGDARLPLWRWRTRPPAACPLKLTAATPAPKCSGVRDIDEARPSPGREGVLFDEASRCDVFSSP